MEKQTGISKGTLDSWFSSCGSLVVGTGVFSQKGAEVYGILQVNIIICFFHFKKHTPVYHNVGLIFKVLAISCVCNNNTALNKALSSDQTVQCYQEERGSKHEQPTDRIVWKQISTMSSLLANMATVVFELPSIMGQATPKSSPTVPAP